LPVSEVLAYTFRKARHALDVNSVFEVRMPICHKPLKRSNESHFRLPPRRIEDIKSLFLNYAVFGGLLHRVSSSLCGLSGTAASSPGYIMASPANKMFAMLFSFVRQCFNDLHILKIVWGREVVNVACCCWNLKGFGSKDAEIIRNVLIAYLSEKSYLKEASTTNST